MDKLDKLIQEHREAFDEEPREDHLLRFEKKLDQYHTRRKIAAKGWPFLKIASLLIIILLSVNLFIHLVPNNTEKKEQQVAFNEMDETANFYTVKINNGISQLKKMADQGIGSEQELNQVKKELNEMDLLYQELQHEYSKNPDDERVVNAMIEYYRTKLDIINKIKTDLENLKSLKNRNNENTQL